MIQGEKEKKRKEKVSIDGQGEKKKDERRLTRRLALREDRIDQLG